MKALTIVLAAVAVACASDTVTAPEPSAAILNGATKAAATTHWNRPIGAATVNLGLYADGTATFNACGSPVNITWTRTGPSSITLTGFSWSCSTTPGFQGTVTGFVDITGSVAEGVFTATANLNG